jgi:Tfp pilus assembly PilM family ATPase
MDYAFREMPGSVSGISRESLAEHFARTVAMLGTPFKEVILVIGMEDVLWRDIDLPAAELSDLRKVIRFNARTCFQQDVSDYAIDCTALTPVEKGMDEESSKRRKAVPILAAGIKKELLTKLKLAAEDARLKVVELLPSQTGVLNAVMLAKPEAAQKEAMIVIGLEVAQATISFVVENTLMLTRVVAPSEGNLRTQLTEAFKTGAEIPADFRWEVVQSNVKTLFTPLAEEFKAAIDYFEDVHGRRVRHGFVTGELAGSELIINTLQDLQIPCQQLDSSGLFQSEHLPQERKESLTKDFVQLAGAIGAAVVWLSATGIQINFLAEEIAEAASRRRDPFRIGCKLAALLVILMLSWAGWLHSIASRAAMGLKAREPEIVSTAKASREATLLANRAGEAARSAAALEQHATNRFRAGPLLKALSHTTLDDIQMVHVSLRQQLIQVPATKSGSDGTKTIPAKPEHTLERVVLRVQAKNFGDAAAEDRFIEINSHQSYFQEHLSSENPIVLKARLPRQVDPLDSSKTFTLFTLDYVYPERVLGHE